MRKLKNIEMANDNEIFEMTFDGKIEVKQSELDDGYDVLIDGEEIEWFDNQEDAIAEAEDYTIDDMLIVSGYGTHSGRKFWQLPVSVKNQVRAACLKHFKKEN